MWLVPGYLKTLILPPASILIVALAGWLIGRRRPRLGRGLVAASLIALYWLSTPVVAGLALKALEGSPLAPEAIGRAKAEAIVILGAGIESDAPEYGADVAGPYTLERLRYGAWLHRASGGVPILVAGGTIAPAKTPLARVMARALEDEFRVPVRWIEDRSRTTYENAQMSRAILARAGIRRIFLVTHAAHMPRAKAVFEAAGFEVVPAATRFQGPLAPRFEDFLPTAGALSGVGYALYEWAGRLWYAFAYPQTGAAGGA